MIYSSLITRLLRLYYLVVAMLQGGISLVTRLSFLYGKPQFNDFLREYNEIRVFIKPSSSTCQVCVSAVLITVLYGTTHYIAASAYCLIHLSMASSKRILIRT